ncbi:hypothetical protein M8C21_013791 [Ambrosia artemisiifolia]|uniref:non-specific serine/threonine protein kinase n=1 Tax=Ambrosia artemisiifolia TaxID=4212 RepID=A0AAD5C7W7_AMBAR|nr:hypothetical protein M8C21_013791 [Ambrosia artemisiifolia]
MGVPTILLLCFHTLLTCTIASDTLSVNQTIRDGQTIVSTEETFELGFFSPSNTSQNRYLGIWYKNIATCTVIWVANRETPISNKSGELTLNHEGLLVLHDSTNNQMIWSSSTSKETGKMVAQLLDNSNFIVFDREQGPENYIWQSFDHIGNTYMPEMKFGRDLKRGIVTNFTSWKSDDDPSPGPYMIYMNYDGYPQTLENNTDKILYRLGSWNGIAYTGRTNNRPFPMITDWFYMDEFMTWATYKLNNNSVLSRLTLSAEGMMGLWNWNNRTQQWILYTLLTTDSCERYALCGVYGFCNIAESPNCGCLRGFTPKRPDQWEIADWTSGCQREIPLDCSVVEGFRKKECNCTAYATLDIKLGIGCMLWYNELIDMRILPDNGQDIYIRMSAAELGRSDLVVPKDGLDIPLFNLSTLTLATDNFSFNKKLGEGGFGPVYKGTLEDGREIAVKRLSVVSTQGVEEFKNEVIFISKLQHRNLVNVLGYCVEGTEKLLVYEFMPNSSLDLLFLFFFIEETKTRTLNWSQRFRIINGIARGLLYLHQDSLLRIIHRDLKAANILLDHEMNPKISDFGLARSFGGNEIEINTRRVVGT